MRVIVGITGGSGAIYAVSLLKALKELNVETHLIVSKMGEFVLNHECDLSIEEISN
jgi:3-polyprenyl-4-hydroxybenzoate decarboxylase